MPKYEYVKKKDHPKTHFQCKDGQRKHKNNSRSELNSSINKNIVLK